MREIWIDRILMEQVSVVCRTDEELYEDEVQVILGDYINDVEPFPYRISPSYIEVERVDGNHGMTLWYGTWTNS